MKILVLGAGGTGGYFGGRLAQSGADVTFLVREKRAAQLSQGLIIESPLGDAHIPVKTVTAANLRPDYAVVILSCKAYDLASSIEAIRPAMVGDACVMPILNGLAHLDTLDAAFGRERVMGGSCQIFATLTREGVVRMSGSAQTIIWGARADVQTPTVEALGRAFQASTVDWRIAEDVAQEMWEKLSFLCVFAAMTSLMRGSIGEILSTREGPALMRRLGETCMEIARREGHPPREKMLTRFQQVLSDTSSSMTASMLRDLEGGHQVEADQIVGYMLDKARQHGIDDTLLCVAYTHLQTYQFRRNAGRALPVLMF